MLFSTRTKYDYYSVSSRVILHCGHHLHHQFHFLTQFFHLVSHFLHLHLHFCNGLAGVRDAAPWLGCWSRAHPAAKQCLIMSTITWDHLNRFDCEIIFLDAVRWSALDNRCPFSPAAKVLPLEQFPAAATLGLEEVCVSHVVRKFRPPQGLVVALPAQHSWVRGSCLVELDPAGKTVKVDLSHHDALDISWIIMKYIYIYKYIYTCLSVVFKRGVISVDDWTALGAEEGSGNDDIDKPTQSRARFLETRHWWILMEKSH